MIRLLDITLSIIALLVLLPWCLPIMIILKFTGEGEIFYAQERIGKNSKKFKLLKFATMLKNSSSMEGGTITVSEDPRILPFGRLLRKTKINELPQLINVLSGDMSLIGPRPMVEKNFSYYTKSQQLIIRKLQPGLSGVGSIAFRNEEELLKNVEDREHYYRTRIAPYKAELEIWFYDRRSLGLYFACIMATIVSILIPRFNLLHAIYPDLPSDKLP